MRAYERKIVSGNMVEVERYVSLRTRGKKISRRQNVRESDESQKARNRRESERNLLRKINCNFVPGDRYVTLTYATLPASPEEAKEHLARYLRRIRTWCRKNGVEFKYIQVTEYLTGGRIHHHVILPRIPEEVAEDTWSAEAGHGHAKSMRLYQDGHYVALAKYLSKERRLGSRWSGSRSLKSPKIEIKRIEAGKISHKIRVPHGWTLDKVYEEIDTGFYHYARMYRPDKPPAKKKKDRKEECTP